MPTNYSTNIVYLSKAQYQELLTNQTITVNGTTVTYNENDIYVTPQAEPITDVKINGTSIGSNGVANIPVATSSIYGAVKAVPISINAYGVGIGTDGILRSTPPMDAQVKTGEMGNAVLTPAKQHQSAFYGLAKAAGHDEKNSAEPLGTYTDGAKQAIQNMLGITDLISTEESSTATAAHALNSTFMMNGKLHRATAAIAIGDAVEVGTNCEVVSVSDAFAAKKDTVLETTLSMGRKAGTTVGEGSVAFGWNLEASGKYSHAEGNGTIASGNYSHAEGTSTQATGTRAHSEGTVTQATGMTSHAEGMSTISAGMASHAAGRYNVEDSFSSWPEWIAGTSYDVGDKIKVTITVDNETTVTGYICKTANSDAEFTAANWTKDTYMNYAEIIGNGTSYNARSNARALTWTGDERLNGYLYVGCNADSTGGVRVPHDVQINGTSVVSNGIANIPKATTTSLGVVRPHNAYGINAWSDGALFIDKAPDSEIKTSSGGYKPITPATQDKSVFYGLAKAAGDTTQSISTNAVGTYTSEAKAAIQSMLDVPSKADVANLIAVSTTAPSESEAKIWIDTDDSTTVQVPTVSEMNLALATKVGDVQVNGTSVVSNGVANIPYATTSTPGVIIKGSGLYISNGILGVNQSSDANIKGGVESTFTPVSKQHYTVFYGLAKAAGADMASSDNAVGTYTDSAKTAIRNMLGAVSSDVIAVQDEQPTTTDTKVWLPETEAQGIQVPTMEDMANYVQKTDYASTNDYGIVKIGNGLTISNNKLSIQTAGSATVKQGTASGSVITPEHEYEAAFYGLAKAAGDTTQSISTNAVGTYTDEASAAIRNMLGAVGDVQINSSSVISNGVANIPVASSNTLGVVKVLTDKGISLTNDALTIYAANSSHVKTGTQAYFPVVPGHQHEAAFYGLAKAAGDTTQSASSNAVGTYTAEAKAAIHTMLGIDPASIAAQVDIPLVETVTGTTPSITGQPNVRYVCDEVSTITLTPPASGSMDVIFESGSTAAVLTVPNTVKWPAWFDAATLETDTIYEILITDGVYGSVMTWAT